MSSAELVRRVTGLGGVFVKARDAASLSRWYAEHLGVPIEVEGEADAGVSALFRWREHETPEREGLTVWALFPQASTYLGEREVMLNYRVADLDALLAVLKDEGVWIDPHREEHDYGRFAWIKDGEGNRVELWQPAGG